MTNVFSLQLEYATLTRVGYVDTPVPPELVGLDAASLASVPWADPDWSTDGLVRVGAAVWFADIGGRRFAFDPVQAADAVLRADAAAEAMHQTAIASTLTAAGFPRERVDVLAMTHIEGVGMVAWKNADGSWSPFFPNAVILISEAMLRAFESALPQNGDAEYEAWQSLIAQGHVRTFADGEALAPCLTAHAREGHGPGHVVFRLGAAGARPQATFLGHLAVSPIHLATGPCATLNADPDAAWAALQEEAEGADLLIGPLWPGTGAGRWQQHRLVPLR